MMFAIRHIIASFLSAAQRAGRWGGALLVAAMAVLAASCEREPLIHLHHDGENVEYEFPELEFQLDIYWDYELDYGVNYNWRDEWYYGDDPNLYAQIGYTKPDRFELRRYFTGETPYAPHTNREEHYIHGYTFRERFDWGYWDLMIWNQIIDQGDGQALQMEEHMDSVIFHTPQTPYPTRHTRGTRFTRSFYQPEELFSVYRQAEHISRDLEGFIYDPERNVYVKRDSLDLRPSTYIYLTQVILHNNRGRVSQVDGNANLSGMARSVNIATGRAGLDPITTYYNVGMKKEVTIRRKARQYATENVDIIGGRLLTFGMCGIDGSRVGVPTRGRAAYPEGATIGYTSTGNQVYSKNNEMHIDDGNSHYMDVTMHFSTGGDSTFVFDVTDQVRRRWKGGVLTVELDMDTISIPSRNGGSGFDATVEDYEEVDAYPEGGWEI